MKLMKHFRLRSVGRAFAYRNFRLFFIGQTTSLIGSWMQQIAMAWLVFALTHSSFLLGVVLFLGQIPCLFLPPMVGVYIDQWDRRLVLELTQTAAMILAFVLAALTLLGVVAPWQIMIISLLGGIVVAFDMPARHAFTVEMVTDRRDLANAVALSSVMFNAARLIGPALAGWVLAQTSAGMCFLFNGISFIAVILSLWMMRVTPAKRRKRAHAVSAGMKEGVLYAWHYLPVRNVLLLLSLGGMTNAVILVVLPELTTSILQAGPEAMGWLSSAMGVGALLAGFLLAARRSVMGIGKWIGGGIIAMGAGMLALPWATSVALSCLAMFVTGFGLVVHIAGGNTLIQTIVEEDKRGRVMSFYTMAIVGMVPFGSFLSGLMAEGLGVSSALSIMGGAALLSGVVFIAWLPQLGREVAPVLLRLKVDPAPLEE